MISTIIQKSRVNCDRTEMRPHSENFLEELTLQESLWMNKRQIMWKMNIPGSENKQKELTDNNYIII